MEIEIGTILDDKYRIERLLGRGGMGAVYEAKHVLLNRYVAVKILNPSCASDEMTVRRFIQEGQTASAIDHPNVIDIQDFGKQKDGTTFIVMELLKGDTLQAVLNYRFNLPVNRCVSIALQVLSAVHTAHEKKIIHRDLKPENIYIMASSERNTHVKIVDFGVAKVLPTEGQDMRLTRTGVVLGTPYYLSPEQASGGKIIDERIDLWSIGVILYQMLTGRLPFEGDNYNEILTGILMKDHVPVRDHVPEIPDDLAKVVDKALAKKRELRYESAAAMIEALMPFSSESNSLMSSSASNALRDSFLPPSPPNGEREVITTYHSNPFAQTIDSDEMNIADSRPMKSSRSLRTAMISGVSMLVIGVVLTAFVTHTYTFEGQRGATRPSESKQAQNVSPHEFVTKMKKTDAEHDRTKAEPLSKHATIELSGLPPEAKVTLDGKRVNVPFTTEQSQTPMILKVVAPGYLPSERILVPTEDQQLSIPLIKKKSKIIKKVKEEKKENPKKPDNKWRANPFASTFARTNARRHLLVRLPPAGLFSLAS